MEYSHKSIEKKWQNYWEENKTFKTTNNNKNKSYVLDMFPYPSGAGLHVGHPKGYIASDVYARFKRMNGFDVLHPIGWDAFGLPAEQYAIQTNNDPGKFTDKNIQNFKKQLKSLGLSYDYDKEINTSKPYYYKTTQFIFKKLYENGLAELRNVNVNWCEKLGTVLANEEVLIKNGKMVSERGDFPVIKKPMKQWVLKITKYANKLLDGLDDLDWPDSVKTLQHNWIGKSKGIEVNFKVRNSLEVLKIFTTRIDTISGVTYIAISPENSILDKITSKDQKIKVKKFINLMNSKTEIDRQDTKKNKNGIFTGYYAINPFTNENIPIWVADYVLPYYATGIVMGVPGHDMRDYDFAKKYNIKIKYIIENKEKNKIVTLDGKHINSGIINGLNIKDAKEKLTKYFINKNIGKEKEYFKLRDWLFSRQRYWGEPFPIIHWEDGSISVLNKDELPLILPKTKNFKPSSTGESPLINCKNWVNVVSDTGLKGKRETNTMPQWAGSCWYYIAYILIENGELLDLESKEAQKKLNKWLPVDLYIGGQEHAVLHLLYARFWHKFLYDNKLVPTKEPFQRLVNQGMILGPDGNKMSKSKNNVISPDGIISSHGSDAFRLYEMFMGPIIASLDWSQKGLDGSRKWLDRVYRLFKNKNEKFTNNNDGSLDFIYNSVVKEVSLLIEKLELNIAISKLMTLVNQFYKVDKIYIKYFEGLIKMLSIFSPHISEEMWSLLGHIESITYAKWPKYEKKYLLNNKINFVIVQVDGKLKFKFKIDKKLNNNELLTLAKANKKIIELFEDDKILNTIIIENKLINFVTKTKK